MLVAANEHDKRNRPLPPHKPMAFVETNPRCLCVREVTGTEVVRQTFRLRYEVWKGETTLRPEVIAKGIITDEHDAHARHWAVFNGKQLVGAARMCIHHNQENTPDARAFDQVRLPVPIATINRLVVDRSARGHTLGYSLCKCRIEAARKSGARCVVGTAVEARIGSLEASVTTLVSRCALLCGKYQRWRQW